MASKRSTQLSGFQLVLPKPSLPSRPQSLLSSSDMHSSPQTPRNSLGLPSPNLFKLDSAQPRRSTDSWSSSIAEGGDDDMDWEWTPEQVKLLNKTLDALPSHMLSPYNGVIPPTNILDKISRSIIHAKDPLEWPHSIRATRIMLLKLSRDRAAECARNELSGDILQNTGNIPKKPLYRQSSMDFLNGKTLKDESNVERLSNRLQRVDRIIPNPTYAYDRYSSRTPPSTPGRRPHGLADMPSTPRTPGSDDVRGPPSSMSSTRGSKLRRSTTTMTGLPTIPAGIASHCVTPEKACIDLPGRKIRRSESFTSHLNGLGHSLKRAPSYGSISARSVDSRMSVDEKENSPFLAYAEKSIDIYPSSDEEEKKRSRSIKKHKSNLADRTRERTPSRQKSQKSTSSTLPKTASSATLKANAAAKSAATATSSSKPSTRTRKISAKKITVTPSSFGAALPHPQLELPVPVPRPIAIQREELPIDDVEIDTEAGPSSPIMPHKRLRRVKTTNFPPRIKRKISFNHLSAPLEKEEGEHTGAGLGSAFQLS